MRKLCLYIIILGVQIIILIEEEATLIGKKGKGKEGERGKRENILSSEAVEFEGLEEGDYLRKLFLFYSHI